MSTGFKLFLLMILAFAAVWIFQFSSQDLVSWLDAPERIQALRAQSEISKSPVETADGIKRYDMEYRGPEVLREPSGLEKKEAPLRQSRGGHLIYADPGPGFDPLLEPSEVWLEGDGEDEGDDEAYWPEDDYGEGLTELVEWEDSESEAPLDEEYEELEGQEELEEQDADEAEKPLRLYTVVAGDSLCKIAKKLLGKESRHQEIKDMNKGVLKGGTTIHPGMTLLIPPED